MKFHALSAEKLEFQPTFTSLTNTNYNKISAFFECKPMVSHKLVKIPEANYSNTLSFIYFLHFSNTACMSAGISLSKNNFSPVIGWVIPSVLACSA